MFLPIFIIRIKNNSSINRISQVLLRLLPPTMIWLFRDDKYKLFKWTTIGDDILFYRPLTNNALKSSIYYKHFNFTLFSLNCHLELLRSCCSLMSAREIGCNLYVSMVMCSFTASSYGDYSMVCIPLECVLQRSFLNPYNHFEEF